MSPGLIFSNIVRISFLRNPNRIGLNPSTCKEPWKFLSVAFYRWYNVWTFTKLKDPWFLIEFITHKWSRSRFSDDYVCRIGVNTSSCLAIYTDNKKTRILLTLQLIKNYAPLPLTSKMNFEKYFQKSKIFM